MTEYTLTVLTESYQLISDFFPKVLMLDLISIHALTKFIKLSNVASNDIFLANLEL